MSEQNAANGVEVDAHKNNYRKATPGKYTKQNGGSCASFAAWGHNMSEGIVALALVEYPQEVADALESDVLSKLPLTDQFANEHLKLLFRPERGNDIWQIKDGNGKALVQTASKTDGGDFQGGFEKAKILMWLARSGACKGVLSSAQKFL